jgi:DNA-binding response OmpR family regulator
LNVRVLIAEDDSAIRDLLLDTLARQGYEGDAARDGQEAWEMFTTRGADVILSDWLMPRIEGPELCRLVRAHDAPYTYFILLTALGDQQHHLHGRKSGADDYLAKPFDLEDLSARMVTAQRVVSMHRRRETLLRLARRVATENDPQALFTTLLEEAVALVAGDLGLATRWQGQDGKPAVVARRGTESPALSRAIEAVATQAAEQRRDVSVESALALPLVHEDQLLGTLGVAWHTPRQVMREEAETLETMATLCAAGLAALERARLEGVLLAARTAQHELNNRLGVVLGYAEMLAEYPGLPDSMAQVVNEIVTGAKDLAETVDQLRRVTRIRETPRPPLTGSTLNLTESVAPA